MKERSLKLPDNPHLRAIFLLDNSMGIAEALIHISDEEVLGAPHRQHFEDLFNELLKVQAAVLRKMISPEVDLSDRLTVRRLLSYRSLAKPDVHYGGNSQPRALKKGSIVEKVWENN